MASPNGRARIVWINGAESAAERRCFEPRDFESGKREGCESKGIGNVIGGHASQKGKPKPFEALEL